MESERVSKDDSVRPQFGTNGFFCVELFCGTGNLTYAMKHYFPDSFGVDHKVNKQRVKVVCLDLTREDHQTLVEQWLLFWEMSLGALWNSMRDSNQSKVQKVEPKNTRPATTQELQIS